MALPNPIIIDYGTVDDLTPTEANNIGKNLDALGQKIQKVGDDVWITTNADHDGANWNRLDIAKAATAQELGVDGSVTHYNVPAAANPITWVQRFKVDAAGIIIAGSVPDGILSSNVAMRNAGNDFSADQKIKKSTPILKFETPTSDGYGIRIESSPNGTPEASYRYNQNSDLFVLHDDTNNVERVSWSKSTGKQTAGEVDLNRIGVVFTFTFTSLATNNSATVNISHGLGTDNVRMLMSVPEANSPFTVVAKRPDDESVAMSFPGSTNTVSIAVHPATPASGTISLRLRNETGATRTFNVKTYILRED